MCRFHCCALLVSSCIKCEDTRKGEKIEKDEKRSIQWVKKNCDVVRIGYFCQILLMRMTWIDAIELWLDSMNFTTTIEIIAMDIRSFRWKISFYISSGPTYIPLNDGKCSENPFITIHHECRRCNSLDVISVPPPPRYESIVLVAHTIIHWT